MSPIEGFDARQTSNNINSRLNDLSSVYTSNMFSDRQPVGQAPLILGSRIQNTSTEQATPELFHNFQINEMPAYQHEEKVFTVGSPQAKQFSQNV